MKRNSSNLTPSQTANLLAVSPSTLRLWSTQFANYLSDAARSDGRKHRSYSPDDIGVLKRASDLLKTHSPDETRTLLSVGDDTQRGAALATLPSIANELQALRDAMMLLRSDVAANQAEIERLRGEVVALFERQRKKQAAQQAELEAMRAQLADLQARRHWWQRLRKP